MGSGRWTSDSFTSYSSSQGRTVSKDGFVNVSKENAFKQTTVHKTLDSRNIAVRECCNSAEHPNTIPIILALDVTGSMSTACDRTLSSLGVIITNLYKKYKDIEFCIMGIGDVNARDRHPIQMGQFESDIRIAKDLDRLYLEKGGGGNGYETYTTAWFMGTYKTKLDCWDQGRKGIIITMGDEPCNPYLDADRLKPQILQTDYQIREDIDTKCLYEETKKKFDIYHISIDDPDSCYRDYQKDVDPSWEFLGSNYMVSTIKELPDTIVKCIDISLSNTNLDTKIYDSTSETQTIEANNGSTVKEISW